METPVESKWGGFDPDFADDLGFALILVLAVVLGRRNMDFLYPHILWSFLALLAFNLIHILLLRRRMRALDRSRLSVFGNTALLTVVMHYSGGAASFLWVMYLLPVFTASLKLNRRDFLGTGISVILFLGVFHVNAARGAGAQRFLEWFIKAVTIATSAAALRRVARREENAKAMLHDEQSRIEGERCAMRQSMQHMDRLATLGTLTASITHELKNPLNTVLGYSALVSEESLSAEELKNAMERIKAAVGRCQKIIQDMLAFSRKKKASRELCDLNALCRECVALKRIDWFSGVTITEDYDPGLPKIFAAGPEFQQVLFNLLVNAQQAARAAGRSPAILKVRTRLEDGRALVSVSDNGPGIAPEILGQIWEPFFTTKPAGEGTGLGLSICKQLVEAQGGSLSAASAPGEGATFTVALPILRVDTAE